MDVNHDNKQATPLTIDQKQAFERVWECERINTQRYLEYKSGPSLEQGFTNTAAIESLKTKIKHHALSLLGKNLEFRAPKGESLGEEIIEEACRETILEARNFETFSFFLMLSPLVEEGEDEQEGGDNPEEEKEEESHALRESEEQDLEMMEDEAVALAWAEGSEARLGYDQEEIQDQEGELDNGLEHGQDLPKPKTIYDHLLISCRINAWEKYKQDADSLHSLGVQKCFQLFWKYPNEPGDSEETRKLQKLQTKEFFNLDLLKLEQFALEGKHCLTSEKPMLGWARGVCKFELKNIQRKWDRGDNPPDVLEPIEETDQDYTERLLKCSTILVILDFHNENYAELYKGIRVQKKSHEEVAELRGANPKAQRVTLSKYVMPKVREISERIDQSAKTPEPELLVKNIALVEIACTISIVSQEHPWYQTFHQEPFSLEKCLAYAWRGFSPPEMKKLLEMYWAAEAIVPLVLCIEVRTHAVLKTFHHINDFKGNRKSQWSDLSKETKTTIKEMSRATEERCSEDELYPFVYDKTSHTQTKYNLMIGLNA